MTIRPPFPPERPHKPVLAILHQRESCPGLVAPVLRGLGHALDIRRPRFGDPLPCTLEGHAGAIVFGGPMSVNDPDDWIAREIDWLAVPLREGKPLLGICLGAQMLAKHLGAGVRRHHLGRVQVGHYRVDLTDAGRQVLGTPPQSQVFHWHCESFTLPPGGRLLAHDDHGIQAFGHGQTAVGMQFHPEVTAEVIRRWMATDPEAHRRPGARSFESLIPTHEGRTAHTREWLTNLLGDWVRSEPAGRRREMPGKAPVEACAVAG